MYREIENLIDLFENAEIFVGKSAAKGVVEPYHSERGEAQKPENRFDSASEIKSSLVNLDIE